MNLTILTATYNRKSSLRRLFESLENQDNKKFKWLIIDDGSNDGTGEMVKEIQTESTYKIVYKKIINGGKSRAVNVGLDLCEFEDFVLIIDDDEELYSNAISIVLGYVAKYYNTSCVGMEFLRDDKNGIPISNYAVRDDLIMSVQLRKRKNYEIDGYTGYFIRKLAGKRFPEFPNEKYVGPGVLQMMASTEYTLVWPAVSLGRTEYIEGGITKQGRKLRIKNPCGMIVYCGLLQVPESGVMIRIKYSIMAFAYSCFIEDLSLREKLLKSYSFYKPFYNWGWLLGKCWKVKYK